MLINDSRFRRICRGNQSRSFKLIELMLQLDCDQMYFKDHNGKTPLDEKYCNDKDRSIVLNILFKLFPDTEQMVDVKKITSYPFKLQEIPKQFLVGDCLFSAISHFDKGKSPEDLRTLAVNHMRSHIEDYIETISDADRLQYGSGARYIPINSVSEYLSIMAQPKVWGGEIEIAALANALNKTIVVVRQNAKEMTENDVYGPRFEEGWKNVIYIGFTGSHYVPLALPYSSQDKKHFIMNLYDVCDIEPDDNMVFVESVGTVQNSLFGGWARVTEPLDVLSEEDVEHTPHKRDNYKYYTFWPQSENIGTSEKFENEFLVQNRHKNATLQNEYDKRFGLVLKK